MKMIMFPRGLGCEPCVPDKRDFTLEDAPSYKPINKAYSIVCGAASQELIGQKESDLSRFVTRVEDQGGTQDCVAYAWTTALEIIWQRSEGKSMQLDPLFVINNVRFLDNRQPGEATSLRAGATAIKRYGAPLLYPPDPSEPRRYIGALSNRIESFWRCDPPINEWGAVDSWAALNQARVLMSCGCPVVLGAFIYNETWTGPDGIIHVPRDTSATLGGHAFCAVGHCDTLNCGASGIGAVKVVSSWGTGWAQKGFGWLPYKYWQNALAWDAFAATAGRWTQDL